MMDYLSEIEVVSLAINLPGPACAARLTELGARVTKVEPPTGDQMAMFSQAWYGKLTEGQAIQRLDLKDPQGQEALHALLRQADLLLTSSRPKALEKIGLGWGELHERYARLCQVAIVGYPAPRQNVAGHDLTYQAESGLLSPPDMPRSLVADLHGAERAATTALALLASRDHTGHGRYAEVPLSEAAEAFAAPLQYGATTPGGVLGGAHPGYGIYAAKDGWIALAALEPHFWQRFEQAVNLPNPQHASVAKAMAERTVGEWEALAESHDLPLCRLNERPGPAHAAPVAGPS